MVHSPGKKSPEKPTEAPILRTMKTTLAAEDPEHPAQGPVWALSVLAAFIVLLGSRISEDIRINKIISCLLVLNSRNKKSSVRALGCLLIRPLAWAYFQPPLPADLDEESEVDDEVRVQRKEARRIHLKMIQIAVECKAGVSTIGAFLGEERPGDNPLRRSIEVLQNMAVRPGKTCEDAMDVMQSMTGLNAHNSGADYSWNSSLLLPRSLFSSIPGLLTAEYKSLRDAVEPIFEQLSTAEDIRCLTPEEMSTPWVFKELMRTWWIVLGTSRMFDGAELPVRYKFSFLLLLRMFTEFYCCSQMLLKSGLVYSRQMSDVCKVCVFPAFILSIIDVSVSQKRAMTTVRLRLGY